MIRDRTLLALTAGVSALCCAPAYAQNAAEDGADTSRLEEIVVTAQRRQQSLVDVPLSITAASGEALQSRGIESVSELRFQTPGFISQSGTGYTQLFIRGIGNIIYVGADPSVATFIDDVPRPYGSLIDNFVNVERVEVLKGAQGGLYGRNATGGVINIVTKQPSNEWGVKGRVSYGKYDSLEAAATVNAPFSDAIAASISGYRRTRDPYLENRARPNPYPAGTTSFFGNPNSTVATPDVNDADFYALDGKLRLQLGERLKITLAGDYARKDDADGNGWIQKNPTLNYLVYRGLAASGGISAPVAPWAPSTEGNTYASIDSYSYTTDYGFSGKGELELDGFDLTSITALRWNNSNFRGDIGAAPVPMAGFQTDFDRKNFYQEVRLVSNGEGPLRWLGGATYYRDRIDNEILGLFLGFPTSTTRARTKTRNYSVYGELSYDLTDALTLTGSLRYVTEKKTAAFPAQAGFGATTGRTKQSKLLPSATIAYDTGEGNLYARYARGFKTGGINPIVQPQAFGTAPGSQFGGETVDAFEVGYRADLFDRRVQFTSAIFYNDYKGLQIARAGNAANPTVSNAILNAGTARTYGAEASLTWRATSAITLSGNLGYLNAKYKKAGYPGSPVVDPFNANGNRMALAPEWQGGFSASLNQPVNDSFRILGSALYSYVGKYNHQYEEDPLLDQPGYSIVNARLGVGTMDERVTLQLFVNNLFDKYYTVFATKNSLGVLTTEAAPRVFGATLEFNF
jgi:iron complex outermembrane recepter protein